MTQAEENSLEQLNHSTLNPYRIAAGMAARRLRWDLQPESWSSRTKIRSWRNRFVGKKAVILCNGPSLLKVDFDSLQGTFCFGLNKINLLFQKTDFRPSCIVAIQQFVLEQNEEFYNRTELPLFLTDNATKLVKSRQNVHFMHESSMRFFSRDCSWSVYGGHTVTYVAMQLAFHMGFSRVALVGCDHNFSTKGPANKIEVAQGEDKSHFDPNYFAHGSKWRLPDLAQSESSYAVAREQFEGFNRKIINATDGGALETFERQTLQDFLSA